MSSSAIFTMKLKSTELTSKLYEFQANVTTLLSKLTTFPVLIGSKFEVLANVVLRGPSNWVSSVTPEARISPLHNLQVTTLVYLREW